MDTVAHLWSFCSLWTGSTLRSCWTSVSFSSLVYKENNYKNQASMYSTTYMCV